MNMEMRAGATDGTLRKSVTDRAGFVEPTSAFNHAHATGFGPMPVWPPNNGLWGDAYMPYMNHGLLHGT